jgi:predicted transcriptional regulator
VSAAVSCRRQAERRGLADGADDVHEWVIDQQIQDPTVDVDALVVPVEGWDEAAINAGVAEIQGVPVRWRDVYYRAYERGGRRAALGYQP